jgi:hypothetical protein
MQPVKMSVVEQEIQAATLGRTADHEADSRKVYLPAHCCEPSDKIAKALLYSRWCQFGDPIWSGSSAFPIVFMTSVTYGTVLQQWET